MENLTGRRAPISGWGRSRWAGLVLAGCVFVLAAALSWRRWPDVLVDFGMQLYLPWQSGSEGKEETQRVHLNPLSGRWERDLSHNQRHVSAAIFYNIWHYFQTTEDLAFLRDYGAEMMLEIARFWASIAHFNPERERYEIHGVMGPDEFHEKYADAAEGGLRNNAYTNVMVAWLCDVAREVLSLLPATRADALRAKLGLGDEELRRWADMSRRMFVPFPRDGIVRQSVV